MESKTPQKPFRVHVYISGKVQGVGYRFSTVQQAKRLGIQGWVRNLRDGRVEAVFEGDTSVVEEMVKWCHSGPASASVEKVAVTQEEIEGIEGFETRY